MTEGHQSGIQDAVPEPAGVRSPEQPSDQAPDYESRWVWGAALIVGAGALLFLGEWPWLLVIGGLVAIITIHELGHYLTAKWSGMKVTEFFIGFGPRLWSFRRGETEYGVKPLPFGAYVRIIGMSNLDEVDPADEARTYRQQSFPKRLLVVLAGPATHFVQALIIVFLLLTVAGMPGGSIADIEEQWVVAEVTDNSAAERAGLEPGDRVVRFDGESIDSFAELTSHIRATQVGDEVSMTVERDGEVFQTSTRIGGRPEEQSRDGAEEGSPFLGLGWETAPDQRLGVVEGLVETPGQALGVTGDALAALGSFFSASGLDNFADTVSEGGNDPTGSSSPGNVSSDDGNGGDEGRLLSIVGAVRLGAALAEEGWAALLLFMLSINIFVGLVNLIPLLPFDGGHASIAIYERIRSRNGRRYYADVAKLLPVAYAVIMGLALLAITTMYLDLVDPVQL